MQEYNADFHIHSKYSGGTSKNMELPVIAKQADLKGLHLVGSGDATNPMWLKHLKSTLTEETDGVYSHKSCNARFIVTAEVEDGKRVHHLILFPSISAAESLHEIIKSHSSDIMREGRPRLRISAEEIVDYVREVEALVGPAHAFTPWTAMYKEYDSLKACYGSNLKYVKYLELGLSADTSMADRIKELSDLTFLSNSDTHSPWPHRLGREFNRIQSKELSYPEIKKVIEHSGGRRVILNVGLNPLEGKYHVTACSRCFLKFHAKDAESLKWRCPECKGLIKRGVNDRICELASYDRPVHPEHRPRYIHILPLAEVISLVTGVSTLTSKKVTAGWETLVDAFGTEINVLVDADISEIKKVDYEAGKIIERFRFEKMAYIPGGGGKYGRPTLKGEKPVFYGEGQRSLEDF